MATREQFLIPKRYNTIAMVLMGIGVLSIIVLFLATRNATASAEELQKLKMTTEQYKAHEDARFWASLLQNSVYFLLVVNAAMFFICATTLAWGGWQMSFRRVTEAISTCVPVIGIILFVVLIFIVA